MMKHTILTDDGYTTLYHAHLDQTYHSTRGAMAETQRVYIELGFLAKTQETNTVQVLEIGFGTGLNALATALTAQKIKAAVSYTTLEPYPLTPQEATQLNYDVLLQTDLLSTLHACQWHEFIPILPHFQFKKIQTTIQNFDSQTLFDVVYFDAFSPDTQPELWTEEIFKKVAQYTKIGGFLTTYSSKTLIRKNLEMAGFRVEKHPGIAGKREVVRGVRV